MNEILAAVAEVDGGSRGNPGDAGCGVVLTLSDGRVEKHHLFLGTTTNNVAEYVALLAALLRARELGVVDLEVISDSELLVKQMLGSYKVKAPHLQPLWLKAASTARLFKRFTIEHVRRELNKRADALANQAMDTRTSTLPIPAGVR
jgi:ribonuclease HI